ncbi:MAG: glycosyltransferase [Flavobacteriales bacterium]
MTAIATKPSVLILSYQFPPVNGTGARRPYYLARQLADTGHRVSVLTTDIAEAQPWLPNLHGISVLRTPKTTVQRDMNSVQQAIARLYQHMQGRSGHGLIRVLADVMLPEGHIDRWDILPEEVEARLGRHDIVLATCPSWYPFRLAAKLAGKWKAMFIADYRDPWTIHIPTLHLKGFTSFGTGPAGWLRTRKMLAMEHAWPGKAFALSAISGPLLSNARMATGVERGAVFHGGYDPLLRAQPYQRKDRFTLVYTGRVYTQQDWRGLLRALDIAQRRDPDLAQDIHIALYGATSNNEALLEELRAYGAGTGMIELLPRTGRDETMRAQQTADAVLHISPDDHQGGLPVKFLEYLGCGRPILLFIKKKDIESDVVQRTRTGVIVSDPQALADTLVERVKEWRQGGVWTITPDHKELDMFNYAKSMQAMVAQLEEWYLAYRGG